MERIWWTCYHRERFAVTNDVEEGGRIWWVLWYHWRGQWVYRAFEEQEEETMEVWSSSYGEIQGVAWAEDGSAFYLVLE